jgi:glucose-6-phosphate isomerase
VKHYRQSIVGCLAAKAGAGGVDPAALNATLARLDAPLADLRDDYDQRRLAILRIVEDEADIVAAEAALAKLSSGAKTIVFYGTGGSSLGGQTLAQLAGWNIPGGADAAQRNRPRTRFYDNLDGDTLARSLASLDLTTTRFVVTSKSGGTVETLAQMVAALDAVTRAGLENRIASMFLVLTEPDQAGKKNALRDLARRYSIPALDHHTGIGGRFSALSNVGLLPALARGVDVRAVRAGARAVVDELRGARAPGECAPAIGAAVAVALAETRGIKLHVMMPYADRLGRFSAWFVQLWAESLGKQGKGSSPIACVGPLDQHSQLQLFMDGPREHLITVVRAPTADKGARIDPKFASEAGIGYLGGRTVGDLVAAQAAAMPEALNAAGRPVRTIDLEALSASSLGALLMHFMLETILVARLIGIDPFDQPAVEAAKIITRERLGA